MHARGAAGAVEAGAATATVAILDDRPFVRAGLRAAIDTGWDVAEGALSEAADLVTEHGPQAVVVPLRGSDPAPYRAIATAKALDEDVGVLVLVEEVTSSNLRDAVIAGADGFVVTTAPTGEIARAVSATVRGERTVSPEIAVHLVGTWRPDADDSPRTAITARELEVLELLAEGLTNSEIAERLEVSPRTVKTHVQNLLAKLEVPDRTGAVARAFRLGLIR